MGCFADFDALFGLFALDCSDLRRSVGWEANGMSPVPVPWRPNDSSSVRELSHDRHEVGWVFVVLRNKRDGWDPILPCRA